MRRKPHDPFFDQGLHRWMLQYAKKNYWRVADSGFDLDDLISEGYVAYARTRSLYARRVNNQAHFMSLYKRVYMSSVHNLASKRSKYAAAGLLEIPVSQVAVEGREIDALELLGGYVESDAELSASLMSAPPEIKALLDLIQSGKLQNPRIKFRRLRNGHRETTNDLFNRLLGLKGFDFAGALANFIKGEGGNNDRLWAGFFSEILTAPESPIYFDSYQGSAAA